MTLLVYGALYGQLVYSQLFLQFLGFSPFEASLFSIPVSLVMILLAGGSAKRRRPTTGRASYLTAGRRSSASRS